MSESKLGYTALGFLVGYTLNRIFLGVKHLIYIGLIIAAAYTGYYLGSNGVNKIKVWEVGSD